MGKRCAATRPTPTDSSRSGGGCDAWLGLTLSGRVWAGNETGRVRLQPPVGDVYAVDQSSGMVFVAGAKGVAWARWQDQASGAPDPEWTVASTEPAEMIAGYQGFLGVSVWYTSRESVCHTGGDPPTCFPVESVTGLAAGRAGAWVASDGELRSVTVDGGPGDPLPHDLGAWFRGVAYDPERGHLWAWGGDTHLHAIGLDAGTHRTYPAVGILGAAVADGSLVIVGVPGLPQTARLP